jgi:hypothetical protein
MLEAQRSSGARLYPLPQSAAVHTQWPSVQTRAHFSQQ